MVFETSLSIIRLVVCSAGSSSGNTLASLLTLLPVNTINYNYKYSDLNFPKVNMSVRKQNSLWWCVQAHAAFSVHWSDSHILISSNQAAFFQLTLGCHLLLWWTGVELFPPFCYSHKDLAGKEPGFTSDNLWGEKKLFCTICLTWHICTFFMVFPFFDNGFY